MTLWPEDEDAIDNLLPPILQLIEDLEPGDVRDALIAAGNDLRLGIMGENFRRAEKLVAEHLGGGRRLAVN